MATPHLLASPPNILIIILSSIQRQLADTELKCCPGAAGNSTPFTTPSLVCRSAVLCCALLSTDQAGHVAQSSVELYNNCVYLVVFMEPFPRAAATPACFSSELWVQDCKRCLWRCPVRYLHSAASCLLGCWISRRQRGNQCWEENRQFKWESRKGGAGRFVSWVYVSASASPDSWGCASAL